MTAMDSKEQPTHTASHLPPTIGQAGTTPGGGVGHSTPAHYNKPVTPWDLERHMETSGNAFVDARRTDAIEYAFRLKDDILGDLRKARHCLDAAIEVLETLESEEAK